MADKVRMTHPKLPGREIWMRPAGVKAREKAGWKAALKAEAVTTGASASTSKKEG